MKLLVCLVLAACATNPIDSVSRPDTRRVVGLVLDSSALRVALTTFRTAYPAEAAICFYGAVRDTTLEGSTGLIAFAFSASPAIADSADEYHVWFPRGLPSGCLPRGLVGVGHSHQQGGAELPCAHSHNDAWALMETRPALFSVVFCIDGRLEVLYQDGRRTSDSWLRAAQR